MARSTTLVPPSATPSADDRPLYRRVAAELFGELRETVAPGERLPSERRLAGRFGVSRETVRQALEVLRRDGLIETDRRGSRVAPPGGPSPGGSAAGGPSFLAFPVGAPSAGDVPATARTAVSWEPPPPEHAEALGLAPDRPTLVHRYESADADGCGLRTAVTSFSAVAVAEVAELARYRDRVGAGGAAQLGRAYDWMRRAGLTLHHRDCITHLDDAPSMRVTRRVHDQYRRPLEITDLVVDTRREALVYTFTLPAAG
ncbi:DNA-binding GntR family transcriptional regulator [Streptomyces achromogenes]|uniref:DNA-binding GntR family transcriptional regulator n=1 Tax=Streptomyces achromogenes TaxID=67255 RepID=A0ABU0PVU6_STRAH|nr:GntR family transcriptional regulator [Streptomyces achromogenes]MDQ0681763.1 DNA-binding GntR family transcriptional regulator [Streptomyces achromogenes]MDQ0828917.1 DNA-binding GntR family transcriptional regulator [Streptomyces achromogenes]